MADGIDFENAQAVRGRAPGDQYRGDDGQGYSTQVAEVKPHAMDGHQARKLHRQLLEWYYVERERQAMNRQEMATDVDFYDNLQWNSDDAMAVRERGQMPLVYNEIAPMVDWLVGTERRARVDWRVLPRTEDDVDMADTKTKVLKYVSDINRVVFNRSRAFADAIKAGVGWMDDGARDDPTEDILYSKHEDWRCVLWDSMAKEPDLSDGRYIFRWRWVDVDIAIAMFPDRANVIRRAAEDNPAWFSDEDEDEWQSATGPLETEVNGRLYASGAGLVVDARRPRVKLIEAQYRMPASVKVVRDGPFRGAIVDERDPIVMGAVRAGQVTSIVDRVMLRMHGAVFVESAMLGYGPSIYRHNRFSLTPVWCYRRGRDHMPYGVVRRVRDIQQDLNKRASKALFMLNTNQVVMDEGAVEDIEATRDEVDRPDGMIVKKPGKAFDIRRDTDAATGQINMMTMAAQTIQKAAGVADENLGRQTNAVSGEAIKARQLQGSVVTTEPLDNLRFATQLQGEKQVSLCEQFYTEQKVIRLTGTKGALEWVRINEPEVGLDGSVRFINDITASQADFQVSEQDYSGTLRQVMFESLNQMAMRLPPEVSLRILTIALEFSDLPNKDEVAEQIRQITGQRDPNKEMSPEEAAQAEEQMRQQAEALQFQREQAMATLEEQRAKVRQLNATAAKLEAEAMAAAGGDEAGMPPEVAQALEDMRNQAMQAQKQAADELDRLSQQLAKAQSELANRTLALTKDADTRREVALIDADTKVRVAEIQKASDAKLEPILKRMDDLVQQVGEANKRADEAAAMAEKNAKAAERAIQEAAKAKAEPPPAPAPTPAPSPAPAAPAGDTTIQVNVGGEEKDVVITRGPDGKIAGAKIKTNPKPKKAAPSDKKE
jgi:hypothetical protein